MHQTVRLNILPIGVEVVLNIDPNQRVVINTQTFSELIHELLNILYPQEGVLPARGRHLGAVTLVMVGFLAIPFHLLGLDEEV